METKKYPAKSYSQVMTSTVMTCAKCGGHTEINEPLMRDDAKFYHMGCVSDETQTAETKVHDLHLTDDLNVKSEGR
jgi:hypothetical protein